MLYEKIARTGIALCSVILLAMSGLGTEGISEWTQSGYDFSDGTSNNLSISYGGVSLGALQGPDFDNWTNITTLTGPSARSHAAMAYDSVRHKMVLFGGYDGAFLCETWTYDSTTNNWTNVNPPISPPPRNRHTMVYDAAHDEIVMFGGYCRYRFLNDTWAYNPRTNRWTNMSPPNAPPPRYDHAMAYDSTDGVILVNGGFGNNSYYYSNFFNDTWIYNFSSNNWTEMKPQKSPSARCRHAVVYNPQCNKFVLYGGRYTGADTWTYDFITNNWTDMEPSTDPGQREGHAMVYDSADGRVVMFGGDDRSNATWTYDIISNKWANMNPPNAPASRTGHAMAYDMAAGKVLLFGGWNSTDVFGDTWSYTYGTFLTNGNYTSRMYDTGGSAYFSSFYYTWESFIPPTTKVRFQFRAADTMENLTRQNFTGPDGTLYTFYDNNNRDLRHMYNGLRWIQYRAYFNSNDRTLTPVLSSMTVWFNLIHSVKILSPVGGENYTGTLNVTWSVSDPDNNSIKTYVSLDNEKSQCFNYSGELPNGTFNWTFNISSLPHGRYRIWITAHDDNSLIPLGVTAFSEYFTIIHSPHIELLSPSHNSRVNTSFVRLAWNGTDLDGDSLNYSVYYSDRPLEDGSASRIVTAQESIELTNLTDNTTYYWTVDASDGVHEHTDVPAEIWNFRVRLPPPIVNSLPFIISYPPSKAYVGLDFVYNLTAVDIDSDILIFTLVQGPPNMSIDSENGGLHWIPSISDIGDHTIRVQVSDGKGGIDEQNFTVNVPQPVMPPPPPEKPRCTITSPANGSTVRGLVFIRGMAINGSAPVTLVQVRIDGDKWLSAIGRENWSLTLDMGKSSNGKHRIEARAFDKSLYSDNATVEFELENTQPEVKRWEAPWYLPLVMGAVVGVIIVSIILKKKRARPG